MTEGMFRVLNWNIGGAKYLELKCEASRHRGREQSRESFRAEMNDKLLFLMRHHRPDVVALQEIVRYEPDGVVANAVDVVDLEGIGRLGYHYWPRWLIDTERHGHQGKWNKVRKQGEWDECAYFAQGNALLVSKTAPHFGVWEIPVAGRPHGDFRMDQYRQPDRHCMEVVTLESGLYFGDRNTEPRAALIAHFVLSKLRRDNRYEKLSDPLDVFVVDLHLTTLMMEREGIPEIDEEASQTRLRQLDTVLNGIISRYNFWRREGFPVRGQHVELDGHEHTRVRHNPIWVVCGDFNFTPESLEYVAAVRRGLIDVMPMIVRHGLPTHAPTKSQGIGRGATITVDYVFAGPRFEAIDPVYADGNRGESRVIDDVHVSDHLPLLADIPIRIDNPIPKDKADHLRGPVSQNAKGETNTGV